MNMTNLASVFLTPKGSVHRQYEALRARYVEELPLAEVAERFEYSYGTVRNLCAEFQGNPEQPFFLSARQRRKTVEPKAPEPAMQASALARQERDQRIVALRKQENLSITEIAAKLSQQGVSASGATVMRVLRVAGIGRQASPTWTAGATRCLAPGAGRGGQLPADGSVTTSLPQPTLAVSSSSCTIWPRIQFDTLLERSGMPGSDMIPAGCAVRALLALKLWGLRRSAHVMAEARDWPCLPDST